MNKVSNIRKAIEETAGQIFSIQFVKKDGSIRDMICRLNVHKDIKGSRPEANEKRVQTLFKNGMVTVWDMTKNAYRVINLTTIRTLKLNGTLYNFV